NSPARDVARSVLERLTPNSFKFESFNVERMSKPSTERRQPFEDRERDARRRRAAVRLARAEGVQELGEARREGHAGERDLAVLERAEERRALEPRRT